MKVYLVCPLRQMMHLSASDYMNLKKAINRTALNMATHQYTTIWERVEYLLKYPRINCKKGK